MPITKRQFELGVDEQVEALMRQIYQFLADHKEHAYSLLELREALVGKAPELVTPQVEAERKRFSRALEALQEVNAVEAREVAGTPYCAYYQEVDTNTWERRSSRVGT